MMRKLIALSLILCLTSMWADARKRTADDGEPAIEYTTRVHDFGVINEADGLAECEFGFTNTGTAPLIILRATASCGCTRPEYPEHPVKPGKSAVIKVRYNPAGTRGEFEKTVTVRTNVKGRGGKQTLTIKGTTIPAHEECDD